MNTRREVLGGALGRRGDDRDDRRLQRYRPRFDDFAFWHEFPPPRKAIRVLENDSFTVSAIRVRLVI